MPSNLPLLNERIYAPYKIAALVEVLAEQGIAPEDSLSGSGVSAADLNDASVLTSVGNTRPCAGTRSLSCESGDAVQGRLAAASVGIRHVRLCADVVSVVARLLPAGREVPPARDADGHDRMDRVSGPNGLDVSRCFISSPSRELREFMHRAAIHAARHASSGCRRRSCPPIKACFSYPAPAHADIYREYLGCPCYFDQAQCELIYDSAILEQKPQLAHQLTATLLQETCDRLIGQAKTSSGVSGEVYQMLMSTPGVFPGMEDVAQAMHMTSRTLRRRLESRRHVVSSRSSTTCAARLRIEYLKTTKMSTDDVAMLLRLQRCGEFPPRTETLDGQRAGRVARLISGTMAYAATSIPSAERTTSSCRAANASPIISKLGCEASTQRCASPAASSSSVSVSMRSRAVLQASTIATGVATRLAGIDQLLRNLDATIAAHIKHERIRIHLLANLIGTGRTAERSQRHTARHAPQRQRTLQRRRARQRSGDPRHHLILDAGRFQRPHFFIGAAEQHRVAAFQAHHHVMFQSGIHDLLVDELLRGRQLPAALAHRNPPRMRRRIVEHGRLDQRVVQHHIGGAEQAARRAP